MSEIQYTPAEKINSIQVLCDYINDSDHEIEFLFNTYDNFDSLNEPIQDLLRSMNKEREFYAILRFKKSGRLRVFKDYEAAYSMLVGMCTLLSEINGKEPLIAIED